jgi:phosphoribosyl-ATP pyrophosphohydrolase
VRHSGPLESAWMDVYTFHMAFGLPHKAVATDLAPEQVECRKRLITEEHRELQEALDSGDLVQITSEAVDLIFVALGTLVEAGVEPSKVWGAIHEANMAKLGPDGKPILNEYGKVQKPEGWTPPDVSKLVNEQRPWGDPKRE